MPPGKTYRESGVNVELGDVCSRIMYEASKRTWENRKGLLGEVSAPVDDFSGSRFVSISGLEDMVVMMNFDSVGTKTEIAERLSSASGKFSFHRTIAHDLFAMVCDDAVCKGGEPVLFGSILEISRLNRQLVQNLAEGMVEAARLAKVAVVNGEIAEVGGRVSGYGRHRYNWGATVLWAAKKYNLINPEKIKQGDKIVGLREKGFRSNGFSLARKILRDKYGEEWHKTDEGKKMAMELLTPSTIYCATILKILGAMPGRVSGIAHITGGGLAGKILRLLRIPGLGASIFDPFRPNPLMLSLQEIGGVDDMEAYRIWSMGTGMAIFTSMPEKAIDIATEAGIEAKLIGEVREEKELVIRNCGFFAKEKELVFKV